MVFMRITNQELEEYQKLKKFARDVITSECFGGEIDGGELQEIAENNGWIELVEVFAHNVNTFNNCDIGDMAYQFTEVLDD